MRFSGVDHKVQKVSELPAQHADVSELEYGNELQNVFDSNIELYRALQDLARFEKRFQPTTDRQYIGGRTRFHLEGFMYLPEVISQLWRNDCQKIKREQVACLKEFGAIISPAPKKYDLLVAFINIQYSEHYNFIKLSAEARALIKLC